jgi:hypothetical protein
MNEKGKINGKSKIKGNGQECPSTQTRLSLGTLP